MGIFSRKSALPEPEKALPGRSAPVAVPVAHAVNGRPLQPPFPAGYKSVQLGMGCFWGAERRLWQQPGIYTTAAGYAGGYTPHPSYEEVCTGGTGHTEVVLVVYDPEQTDLATLLKVFWEAHDPTQGMRQGNDLGTQYRSAVYVDDADDEAVALAARDRYQAELQAAGYGEITTEIRCDQTFYYAEDYHQQYLAKNPDGYCGLRGTGVTCPVGVPSGLPQ